MTVETESCLDSLILSMFLVAVQSARASQQRPGSFAEFAPRRTSRRPSAAHRARCVACPPHLGQFALLLAPQRASWLVKLNELMDVHHSAMLHASQRLPQRSYVANYTEQLCSLAPAKQQDRLSLIALMGPIVMLSCLICLLLCV